jgi:hypothetical protein
MAKKHSRPDYSRKPTKAEVLRARERMAGPNGPGNYKGVELVVADIIQELRASEAVALTACASLRAEGTSESNWAATTLQRGCIDGLTDQIARLERVIEGAKAPYAPRLVVRDVRRCEELHTLP